MKTNKLINVVITLLLMVILALCLCFALLPQINIAYAENGENVGAYVGFANGTDICQTLKDNASVSNAPVITILTPGQGADVSCWSNNEQEKNLSYDSQSLFEKLRLSGDNIKVFISKQSENDRLLIPIQNVVDNKYENYLSATTGTEFSKTKLTEINAHSIILFESKSNNEYLSHDDVYADFENFIDDLAYDYYYQTGQVPKINLIGHSRGGLINLKYANEHPKMIESIFSIGTPYIGTKMGSLLKELVAKGYDVSGLSHELNYKSFENIMDSSIQKSLHDDWEAANTANPNIQAHAIGGKIDADILDDIIATSGMTGIVADVLNVIADVSAVFPLTADIITIIVSALGSLFVDSYPLSLNPVLDDVIVEQGYFYDHIFKKYKQEFSFIFENDLMVDLNSQLATGFSNFKQYERLYDAYDYESLKVSTPGSAKTPHNLETRDPKIIKYILDNIRMEVSTTPYNYKRISENAVVITGLNEQGHNLTELIIPSFIGNKNVVGIDDYAFANGYNNRNIGALTKVTIPETLTSIGKLAFINTNIAEFEVASNNNQFCDIDGNLCSKDGNIIYQYAIGNTQTNYKIPSTITTINEFAFYNANLTSIDLSNVNLIKEFSFQNSKISTVANGAQSITICDFAFDETPYMTEATVDFLILGGNLLKCNFSGALTTQDFPTNIAHISSGAFEGSLVTSLELPDYIQFIDVSAFFGSKELEVVKLHGGIISVGTAAFQNCTSLSKVYLEFTDTSVMAFDVFNNCGDSFNVYVKQLYLDSFKTVGGLAQYSDKLTTETININFNTNGSEVTLNSISIPYYSNLPTLPTPTRNGYEFIGWVDDTEMLYSKNSLFTAKSDTTLYARWTPIQYVINYHLYDSNVINDIYTIEDNVSLKSDITRAGYTFAGWYTNNEFTGEAVNYLSVGNYGEKNYYAKWTANSYKVILNKNADDAVLDNDTISIEFGSNTNLPVPTRPHWSFDGWYLLEDDGSMTFYTNANGTSIKMFNKSHNVELKAKWHLLGYVIEITKKHDGTKIGWIGDTGYYNIGNNPSEINHIVPNSVVNFNELIPDIKGSYDGYVPGKIFSHFSYNEEILTTKNIDEFGESTTYLIKVKAEYTDELHTINYNTQISEFATSSISSSFNTEITLKTFSEEELLSIANKKPGFHFEGWYKVNISSNGQIEYLEKINWTTMPDLTPLNENDKNNTMKVTSAQGNGNIVLYAKWTENLYKLTLNCNNGTITSDTIRWIYYNSLIGELPTPVRNGYSFQGWYIGDDLFNSTRYNFPEDKTITAKWTPIVYSITYDLNGGNNNINPTTYNIETPTFTLSGLTQYGKHFKHWTDASGNIVNDVSLGTFGNLYLKANWTDSKVDIQSNLNYTISTPYVHIIASTVKENIQITLNANVREAWFSGNFNNIEIIAAQRTDKIKLYFRNNSLKGKDNKGVLLLNGKTEIEIIGTLSMESGGHSSSDEPNSYIGVIMGNDIIYLHGDNLEIIGHDGINGDSVIGGRSGYSGIYTTNSVYTDLKYVNIKAGNGGNGVDGVNGTFYYSAGANGGHGTNGTDGGNGGNGVIGSYVHVKADIVIIQAGNGGDGGDGGNGANGQTGAKGQNSSKGKACTRGGRGGDGGNGGNGGNQGLRGFYTKQLTFVVGPDNSINSSNKTLTVGVNGDYGRAGNGGNGGRGGNGGDDNYAFNESNDCHCGGDGGNGGNGGSSGSYEDVRTVHIYGGTGGKGGAGGSVGDDGWGHKKCEYKNGTDGTKGKMGESLMADKLRF